MLLKFFCSEMMGRRILGGWEGGMGLEGMSFVRGEEGVGGGLRGDGAAGGRPWYITWGGRISVEQGMEPPWMTPPRVDMSSWNHEGGALDELKIRDFCLGHYASLRYTLTRGKITHKQAHRQEHKQVYKSTQTLPTQARQDV